MPLVIELLQGTLSKKILISNIFSVNLKHQHFVIYIYVCPTFFVAKMYCAEGFGTQISSTTRS